jgi:hypothetical protein
LCTFLQTASSLQSKYIRVEKNLLLHPIILF